jgi:hypothetical protein
MGWDEFMQMERQQLQERRDGKLRRALGVAVSGESVEEVDRMGEEDRRRAEAGFLAVMGPDGKIFYKHIDDLNIYDMRARVAAEEVQVAFLKERIERNKRESPPPA